MGMQVKTEKPRQTIIGNIYETYSYEIFKTLEGNRDTNPVHISQLVTSMSEWYLLSPIIVNKYMEIIDGQHRFESAKKLKLPIRYIIDETANLRAVQLLNSRSKNWTPDDYMESYVSLGNPEYIKYKEFITKYKMNHKICQLLLSSSELNGPRTFNSGDFKINRYGFACKIADRVLICEEYYPEAKRRSFVYALQSASMNLKFDFKVFIGKLKIQRSKMHVCAKTSQYIELIEEIYNYKNRNKINLRIK